MSPTERASVQRALPGLYNGLRAYRLLTLTERAVKRRHRFTGRLVDASAAVCCLSASAVTERLTAGDMRALLTAAANARLDAIYPAPLPIAA